MMQRRIVAWRMRDCRHCDASKESRDERLRLLWWFFGYGEKPVEEDRIKGRWEMCEFHRLLSFVFWRLHEAPGRFECKPVVKGDTPILVISSWTRSGESALELSIEFPSLSRPDDLKPPIEQYVVWQFSVPYDAEFLMPLEEFLEFAPKEWIHRLEEAANHIFENRAAKVANVSQEV